MMARGTGTQAPESRIISGSGSPALREIQVPNIPPMNPRAIETRHPPRVPPPIARPMEPATAAIRR